MRYYSTCTSASTGQVLVTLNINRTNTILIQGVLTTSQISNFVTNELTFKGNNDISFQFLVYYYLVLMLLTLSLF